MTADRDIERLLDAWLADGPMRVADHAFDEAVGRIHRQRQRPAWRFLLKEPRMATPFKAALGAVAVIAVLVAGFAMVGRSGGDFGGVAAPTATPSPTPSPTPSASLLPISDETIMDAGTYVGEVLPGDAMRWIVTVPTGWTGNSGWSLSGPAVSIAPILTASIPADPCSTATPVPAKSVDELIASVQAHDDWVVSKPVDVTIGGYAGKRIDLELPKDVTACGGIQENYKVIQEGTTLDAGWVAQGPSNRFDLWVLDVEGRPVVIMRNSFAYSPAETMRQSDDIIASVGITP